MLIFNGSIKEICFNVSRKRLKEFNLFLEPYEKYGRSLRSQRHLSASKEQSYVKIHEYPTGESVFNSAAFTAAGTAVIFGLAERSRLWQPFLFGNLGGANETKIAVQIQFKEKNMNKKGFTLLELLVVVLIIGILASIALPQYQKAVYKARLAEANIAIDTMKKNIALYLLTYGYPTSGEVLFTGKDAISDIDVLGDCNNDVYCIKHPFWFFSACQSDMCYIQVSIDDIGMVTWMKPSDLDYWFVAETVGYSDGEQEKVCAWIKERKDIDYMGTCNDDH